MNTQAKKQFKMAFDRNHILGTLFILIAIVMVIQGLWLSHQRDVETKCQADYNQQTAVVVAQRAQWADEDRAALNMMIFTVIDPKKDQADREQAVQSYKVTAEKNDANRKANPLPTRTHCG
jgi:hypothetical protein